MAGRKGRSGPIPDEGNFQAWCATQNRLVAAPKMLACLERRTPDDPSFRWCVEQFAKMSNQYTPLQHEHSGTVQFEAEARAFESRTHRLVERLGSAAIPEWPDRP